MGRGCIDPGSQRIPGAKVPMDLGPKAPLPSYKDGGKFQLRVNDNT